MKRIYKYATGDKIPKEAIYLNTVTQIKEYNLDENEWKDCWYVWHYFLVEEQKND